MAAKLGKFCHACQAIPKHGYCNLPGCPTGYQEIPKPPDMPEQDMSDAPSRAGEHTAPRPYWVSFHSRSGTFELHSPWWISGYGSEDDAEFDIICAALMATDDEDVRRQISACHDEPDFQAWFRFIEPRALDWSPFSDRFRKADWMQWPVSARKDGASPHQDPGA